MKFRLPVAMAFSALTLTGQALAGDVFAGDGRVFSGVASDLGEGLVLPQTLTSGGIAGFSSTFETGLAERSATVVTVIGGGPLAEGLGAFPAVTAETFELQTRVTMGELGWGLTPYIGMGMTSTSAAAGVFQGIPTLLPYESDSLGMQGVAGIAYQLMPGVGAGLEYRYQGFAASMPATREASDNQTIMVRLDLGLN